MCYQHQTGHLHLQLPSLESRRLSLDPEQLIVFGGGKVLVGARPAIGSKRVVEIVRRTTVSQPTRAQPDDRLCGVSVVFGRGHFRCCAPPSASLLLPPQMVTYGAYRLAKDLRPVACERSIEAADQRVTELGEVGQISQGSCHRRIFDFTSKACSHQISEDSNLAGLI